MTIAHELAMNWAVRLLWLHISMRRRDPPAADPSTGAPVTLLHVLEPAIEEYMRYGDLLLEHCGTHDPMPHTTIPPLLSDLPCEAIPRSNAPADFFRSAGEGVRGRDGHAPHQEGPFLDWAAEVAWYTVFEWSDDLNSPAAYLLWCGAMPSQIPLPGPSPSPRHPVYRTNTDNNDQWEFGRLHFWGVNADRLAEWPSLRQPPPHPALASFSLRRL